MSAIFLSACKERVFNKINSLLVEDDKVTSSMKYSALADSKCIRAGLVFASGNLKKNLNDSALTDLATSIELMHTYSLIHDDLPSMDNDDMRRGQPSNHITFHEATSILAGDALQALAYEVIASSKDIKDKQKIEIIKTLTSSCGHQGMILGQQYDLDAEKNEYHDIKKIHLLKTAKLIQAAITLPYLGLYEYKDIYKILQKLGEKLGLAFQIMDDVLEISSNSETLGKNNDSDIKNSKMTYVSVFGLNESIQQAEKISNSCINEIKKKFSSKESKELIELANYMVARTH